MKLHSFIVQTDNADMPLPSTVDFCSRTVSPDYEGHEQDQLDQTILHIEGDGTCKDPSKVYI
jgi:hypothetical protein